LVYRDQGRTAEAVAQWQAAVAQQPDFSQAWHELAQVYLVQGRWDDVEEAIRRTEVDARRPLEAAVLRARLHLARKDFATARQLLEETIARSPRAVYPRQILSHVLLQEGRDWAAAEKALRDVLALDPNHAEAKRNLELLRRQLETGGNPAPQKPKTLQDLYREACTTPSDINEHCPTLYALAKECRHVTEMGTRTGVSTTAFLFAQPDRLVCYDRVRSAQVNVLQVLARRTQFVFHQADVLKVEIEETDLLFIDTWHVYEELECELRLHASRVRKYIVLHDTTTFGERGETEGHRGLWPAIEAFLAQGTFTLKQRYENNNGLTILERRR
jgi:tetratricopeptide (TPR) repeat protein